MELCGTEFTLEYTVIGTFSDHRDRAGLNCILQRVGHMWEIQEAVFYGEIKTKADKQSNLDVSLYKLGSVGESLIQETEWKVRKLLKILRGLGYNLTLAYTS